MTAQLSRLERLRQRDVDRAARTAAAAQATLEQAIGAKRSAATELDEARSRQATAVEWRARHPADEAVQLYLTRCEAGMMEAERGLEIARRDLTTAELDVEQARRDWLRAQVRRDAIAGLATEQRREAARDRERRQADETHESLSSGGRTWA